MRPSTDVSLLLTARAALLSSGSPVPSSDRTLALATARPPWLVGRNEPTREESPEESFCPIDHRLTPLGHPGGTGNRLREQGLGRLLTILPWYPLASNLACINEATPRGESPEATRPDSRGHTARTPIRNLDDTLAHGHARASQSARPRGRTHTHANPGRSANPGVSILRRAALHSPVVMPLVVGCSAEAWVSEPGPGTRTLLLHVPGRNYIWGGLYETICEQHMSRHNRTD